MSFGSVKMITQTLDSTHAYKSELINLVSEIDQAKPGSELAEFAIFDLLITTCAFSLAHWARINPRYKQLGIFLLSVELQAVRQLESLHLPVPGTQPEKDGTE